MQLFPLHPSDPELRHLVDQLTLTTARRVAHTRELADRVGRLTGSAYERLERARPVLRQETGSAGTTTGETGVA